MMTNRFLTEEDKREICSWKYDGEYAVYNLPPYEVMREAGIGFMNAQNENSYRVFCTEDTLVGFVSIREKTTEVVMGIGVRPELCGKHYGGRILNEACQIAKAQFPAKPLSLEVRTWNLRAIKCYQNAGFKIDGEPYELTTLTGKDMFFRMAKNRGGKHGVSNHSHHYSAGILRMLFCKDDKPETAGHSDGSYRRRKAWTG